jgi:transposase
VKARNRVTGKEVVLTHSRWCLLKCVENLTEKQSAKLKELLACNLRTIRAYLLKEEFRFFWEYVPPPGRRSSWTRGARR